MFTIKSLFLLLKWSQRRQTDINVYRVFHTRTHGSLFSLLSLYKSKIERLLQLRHLADFG